MGPRLNKHCISDMSATRVIYGAIGANVAGNLKDSLLQIFTLSVFGAWKYAEANHRQYGDASLYKFMITNFTVAFLSDLLTG